MQTITVPIPTKAEVKRYSWKIALAVLICYLVYVVREIWLPLGLAFVLAMVLDPVVDRMEMRGWSRTRATAFIFGSFLVICAGLVILAAPYIVNQASDIQAQFAKYFPDHSHAGIVKSFHKMNVPEGFAQAGASAFDVLQGGVQKSSSSLSVYGMQFAANLIWVVIIPIVAFYTLRDFNLILTKALLVVPARNRSVVQSAVSEATSIFSRYLRGLGIVSALNGIATAILLLALHVPSAIVLGVVAGILYSVPYIGAIITVVLTAAVAFIGGGAHMAFVAVGASVILHQIIFDQVVSPRILGGHVGLHPILSIVALLAGNLLLGIIGMILAVPIAACIQIAVVSVLPKLAIEVEILTPETSTEPVNEPNQDLTAAPDHEPEVDNMKAAVAAAVEMVEVKAAIEELDAGKVVGAVTPDP